MESSSPVESQCGVLTIPAIRASRLSKGWGPMLHSFYVVVNVDGREVKTPRSTHTRNPRWDNLEAYLTFATSLPTTLKFKIYQAGLFRQDKCIQEFEATVESINDSHLPWRSATSATVIDIDVKYTEGSHKAASVTSSENERDAEDAADELEVRELLMCGEFSPASCDVPQEYLSDDQGEEDGHVVVEPASGDEDHMSEAATEDESESESESDSGEGEGDQTLVSGDMLVTDVKRDRRGSVAETVSNFLGKMIYGPSDLDTAPTTLGSSTPVKSSQLDGQQA